MSLVTHEQGRSTAALVHPEHPLPALGYGGDYNPEQWPEEMWAQDVSLMAEAGVTFVSVAIFAWARIQPSADTWDFDWLDRVLDLMHAHGIGVDLATATASPPPWLSHAHPEMLPVDRDGRRLSYGSRQSWCPSSTAYREASLHLVEAMAARYAEHPALVMWHVSNELGCHNAHCYCERSDAAFRRWLTVRYGDLASLNRAWGTAFWSQAYTDWEQVLTPRASTAQNNPTQRLDYLRFSSEELLGQHRAEREVLQRLSPGVPVTTNFMVSSHIDALDYWRWAPEQDVVSKDHYLDGRIAGPPRRALLLGRLDPRARAGRPVGADGALHRRRQLAAPQRTPRVPGSCSATACSTSRGERTRSASSSGGPAPRGPRSTTPPWSRTPVPTPGCGGRSSVWERCSGGSLRSPAPASWGRSP